MGRIANVDDKAKIAAKIKEFKSTFYSDFSITYDSSPLKISITFREGGKDFAGFTLVEQINCCGMMVSTKTFVNEKFRGQGIAQEMMPIKESIAKEFGYSALIATVNITGNPAEAHILEKHGWKKIHEFKNSRTTNIVGIFVKNI